MNRRAVILLAAVLTVLAACLLLWPYVRGKQLESEITDSADNFLEALEPEKSYPELYEAMAAYNKRIYAEKQAGLSDPWAYETASFDLSQYGVEDEVIAVLEIPKLSLSMPVYLGASADHMALGAAHLSQTSLPIGGSNTNCVIAGHRGWQGADYFLHLDKLAVGDTVTLSTLWDTLEYHVVEARIIEPSDVKQVLIQENRELLTLLTCHPYASGGRQRLAVYCERISKP